MSTEFAMRLVLALAGIAVALSSLETLFGYRSRQLVGRVGCYPEGRSQTFYWRMACLLFGSRLVGALVVVTLATIAPTSNLQRVVVPLVAAISLVTMSVFGIGQDGAEEAAHLVFLAAALAELAPSHGNELFLAFIAAQGSLAFATAAIGKLCSPVWGTGQALYAIFSVSAYGAPWTRSLLQQDPQYRLIAERSLIALQLSLAIAWLLPPPLAAVIICFGMVFHFVSAAAGGLYKFVWSFGAFDVALLWASFAIWQQL